MFLLTVGAYSQKRIIHISQIESSIEIDGVLNESFWGDLEVLNNFQKQFPIDSGLADSKTEVMITFDQENLIIGARCFDDFPDKKFVVSSLKRDYSYPISDAFAIFIDPFNDKTNGFSFSVNPYGVQREGSVESAGSFGVTTAWDNKWYSAVSNHKDYWSIEMVIPFKSIRFSPDIRKWGVNFSRNDLKRNESSAWSRVPINFNVATLNFTGEMIWDDPPPIVKQNISLIPYSTFSAHRDSEYDTKDISLNAGFDAKLAVSSSLNLDVTINPDFSNVDVDRQVTNLSRFSLFFPERRQFFIENSDLFGGFGFRKIRPFFSRRIGLYEGNAVPIIAGARLSGKMNKNWRIGCMNIQTAGDTSIGISPQNYTVGAFQRQIGPSSNIAAIVVNQQTFDSNTLDLSNYNRVVGLDYNLASEDGKWRGKLFYHRSFDPDKSDQANASWIMYNTKNWRIHWNHEYVGENFRANTGFVPRVEWFNQEDTVNYFQTYWRFEPSITYSFFSKNSKLINRHSFGLDYDNYLDKNWISNEEIFSPGYFILFNNQSEFSIEWNSCNILLPYGTDVTFNNNPLLDAGRYRFNIASIAYESNPYSLFKFETELEYGSYFTGNKASIYLGASYRIQPYGVISLVFEHNNIKIPGIGNSHLNLISPRFDLTLTKKIFFTTFIQYNTQQNNVNINSRFQYRFKPMSDLFIVYTDNYYATNFLPKNKALVVKFVYWLNV